MKKVNNLMFDLTNNSTSEPLLAEGVFSKAILNTKTFERFDKILNAKDKVKLGIHEFGDVIQTASCNPEDTGAGTLSEKEVNLCSLDVYFTICQRTLEQSFISSRLAAGSNNANFLPTDFQAYIAEKLAEKISADLEVAAFQGNTSTGSTYPASICDGIELELTNDSDVVDVTGTTVTSSNVVAEIGKVYNAMSDAVLKRKDRVIYVASNVARAYRQALAAASAEAYYNQKDLRMYYLDVEVVEAPGLSSNKMIGGYEMNFKLLTDLVSDYNDIMIIPMLEKTGKHHIVVSGTFKFKTTYVIGSDIVFYS